MPDNRPKTESRARRQSETDTRLFAMRKIATILALGFLAACSEKEEGIIDFTGLPPFLSQATVSPEIVNTDTLLIGSPGMVSFSLLATAEVEDPDGLQDIAGVQYSVRTPEKSEIVSAGQLRDDGINPDLSPSDGSYNGAVTITIDRNEIGNYTVEFFATDRSGLTSNAVQKRLIVVRQQNSPPVISNLVAPDTVQLPQTGSVVFLMAVDATDPQGLSDIAEVFFRSLDSSDPNRKFLMKDDGNTPTSGDEVQGDGTYSIKIELASTNNPGTFRFEFQASDKAGAASNTILHLLTVIR